ncbi:MAG: DNA primase [Actinobacteria bacterium]|nr:MAG: DNA primase [Actinomycetota bacterium]
MCGVRISQRSIEAVREGANIVEVASEFTALRRVGARFTGLCPYPDHNEKSPSFGVSPEKGFYHCFGCLEANERIWTSRGLIPIAAAEIGDEVIGLDGRRETITDKVFKSKPTLKIRTGAAKEGLELTPDHWCVFVEKEEALRAVPRLHLRHRGGEQIRFSSKLGRKGSDAKLSVKHAADIREGDFLLYPVIPAVEREDAPLIGEHVIKPYTSGPRNVRTTSLHVNDRTAWLYGVYAAEGSLYRGGVKWSFSADESETLAEEVSRILDEEFAKPSTKRVRQEKNICEVTCSSTDLSALFRHWFGSGCAEKRVPIEALNWTPETQAAFVQGYLDGDGRTQNGSVGAATVSEELAYGVFALLIQMEKPVSINSYPARTAKDGVSRRKTFALHMPRRESMKGFFAPVNGTTYYWSVVQEIEDERKNPATVVDITTTGSHTFLTKMGTTHNCQRGGDAIKLVMELKNLPFAEAVSHLGERFGIELEFEGRSPGEERAAKTRTARRRSAYKALAAAAVYYHKYFLKASTAEEARRYLKGRGMGSSTIEEFRLGYAPPRGAASFSAAARKIGLERSALDAAGLLSPRGGERFVDRVTFPISDLRGRIVGFGARTLGDAKPKYLNSPETELFNKRSLLYGLPQAAAEMRREKVALIVEGYTDVLMLNQAGIKNSVATLGTAMTEQHLKSLSGYAETIHLIFDPDEAGEKAVERAAATAAELKLDLRVLRLSEDPADWLLEHPAEEFRELLSGAVPVLEYIFRRKADRARGSGAAERSRVMSEIKGLIKEIRDPVFYRDALRLATEALGVNARALRSAPEPGDGEPGKADRPARRRPRDPVIEAGREVLAHAFARPGLAARAIAEGVEAPGILDAPFVLKLKDFGDETQAHIYALLLEHADEPGALLADERVRPLLDEVSALQAEGERLDPSEASLRAAWFRLGALSRERAKARTEDFDEKLRLHTEARQLRQAASNMTPES